MKKHFPVILLLICICVSCTDTQVTMTNDTTCASMSSSIPISSDSASPIRKDIDYEIVYASQDFCVWQALIGSIASFNWIDVPIPERRIEDANLSLDVEYTRFDRPSEDGFVLIQTIEVPNDNSLNTFVLKSQYADGNGNVVLTKNGRVIWEGFIYGGYAFGIDSLSSFQGEILFGFHDYSGPQPDKATDYVLYTEKDNVVIIPSAFAPNIVNGEFLYFKRLDNRVALTNNGLTMGELYDSVLIPCCGYQDSYGVANNGSMIDFFATINDNWYHVQAGVQK